MSLATRCPSCGTAFRVVQDQLKVSEGWVRCGNCQDVFNALESLFDLAPEARHKASVPMPLDPPAAPADSTPAVGLAADGPAASDPERPEWPERTDGAAPPASASSWPDAALSPPDAEPTGALEPTGVEDFWAPVTAPEPAGSVGAEPGPLEASPSPGPEPAGDPPASPRLAPTPAEDPTPPAAAQAASDRPDASALGQPTPAWTGIRRRRGPARTAGTAAVPRPLQSGETTQPSLFAPDSLLPAGGAAPQPEAAPPAPAFVRRAEQAARWQSPAWRAGLATSALLLLLVLGLQVSLFQRDLLATRWPALRPPLSAVCQALGCAVGPPRAIDQLVLDNSRLNRTSQPGVLQLVAELHNRGASPVRKPALEVSFTDASGQLVARKVFAAQQLDPGQQGIEANAPWTVEVGLRTIDLNITGFTMEVFYP
jgi:predicted Zn finger-like uncharacterized protein